MSNLTFCINTANNERNHIELLFRSLYVNLSSRNHDIIVYIENDNQGTTEFLISQKEHFPNLTIIKNPLPIAIGCQQNMNMMFRMAKTDIVSYLQSDMVVGPKYDEEVLKLVMPGTFVSSTRIEPPLHPPSPEKITHDFGMDPLKFELDTFSKFVEKIKNNKVTDYWFAPFTFYKSDFNDIGGFDSIFRRSRCDSDLLYRFSINKIKTVQSWNAIVYHFTCTSSRGPEWWTDKNKERVHLQSIADTIEMKKFLRKWPSFKHSNVFDPNTEFKYQISANFYNALPKDYDLLQYYFMFHRIYIDNPITQQTIKTAFSQMQTPANTICNISTDQWDCYKKHFRTWEYEDIYSSTPIINDDVIYNIDLKKEVFSNYVGNPIYVKMQELVHSNQSECPGEFEIENSGVKIVMNRIVNRIYENTVVKNPSMDDIKFILL
jgi:GT2 family glycosyltransferase